MNPLDPHNILPAHSDEARRAHERNVAQPWSLVVACGVVVSLFVWGIVGAVVSGYWVPEEELWPKEITISCFPRMDKSQLQEPEKVICFRPPPPPPHTVAFRIPKPVPEEELQPEPKKHSAKWHSKEAQCPDCDIFLTPPPRPDVKLPPIRDTFESTCEGGIEDESYAMIESPGRMPDATGCSFVDEVPRPVNLKEIQEKIQYPNRGIQPQGRVEFRIQIDPYGRYQQHEVSYEADPRLTETIVPHLPDLRFTPMIQGGRPVSCWVKVPFRFELIRDELTL